MQVLMYVHQGPQLEQLLVSQTTCKRCQSMFWTTARQSSELTRCTMGEMLEYSKNF